MVSMSASSSDDCLGHSLFAQKALEVLQYSCNKIKYSRLPPLIFITDNTRIANPEAVIASLPGKQMVIIRDYDHPNRASYASALRDACYENGHICLIGGDWALCEALEADGCHFPQWQQDDIVAIRAAHPSWIITAATHCAESIKAVNRLKVDAILLSPLFLTGSHPERHSLGVKQFNALAKCSNSPVYALGGVGTNTVMECSALNVYGIAAISGFKC
jgi:thiamine-phosphate pyrophosphorylase